MAAPEVPEKPRRILILQQTTGVGGTEMHCRLLSQEYIRRGIQVVAIVPEDDRFDAMAADLGAAGAQVHRLNTDSRLGRRAQLLRAAGLVRLLRRVRPDVVHIQTGGATGGLLPALLTRLATSATLAHTEHDVPPERPGRLYRLSKSMSGRLVHVLFAVSRRNATMRAERIGEPRGRFASVLNGVDVPESEPERSRAARQAVRQGLGMPPDALVVGSVVRLAAGKGLETLLPAFARVLERRDAWLMLVGEGPLRDQLQVSAESLRISERVVFAGYQADPSSFLSAMDLFVLPVPSGSMSIALLEAMAAGVPPVITFCGPEEAVIAGHTGLCAPPGEPAALATALLRLVEDPGLRTSLGRAARAHVVRHFSIARVADEILEAYAAGRYRRLPQRLGAGGPVNPPPGATQPGGSAESAAEPAASPTRLTATPPRSRTPP